MPVTARLNNTRDREQCVRCGVVERILGPVEAFTATGWLCAACTAEASPKLSAALEWFDREVGFMVSDGAFQGSAGESVLAECEQIMFEQLLSDDLLHPVVATEDNVAAIEAAASHIHVSRFHAGGTCSQSRPCNNPGETS